MRSSTEQHLRARSSVASPQREPAVRARCWRIAAALVREGPSQPGRLRTSPRPWRLTGDRPRWSVACDPCEGGAALPGERAQALSAPEQPAPLRVRGIPRLSVALLAAPRPRLDDCGDDAAFVQWNRNIHAAAGSDSDRRRSVISLIRHGYLLSALWPPSGPLCARPREGRTRRERCGGYIVPAPTLIAQTIARARGPTGCRWSRKR